MVVSPNYTSLMTGIAVTAGNAKCLTLLLSVFGGIILYYKVGENLMNISE